MARLDTIADQIFGNGVDMAAMAGRDREFADMFAFNVAAEGYDVDDARSYVRHQILRVRPEVTRFELIEASRLYLAWLQAARQQGEEQCRDVYSRSFLRKDLQLDPEVVLQEQELAVKFLENRNLILPTEGGSSIALPDWAIREARVRGGLERAEIGEALADTGHPDRCRVTITLLEVLLDSPQGDALPALAAL